MLSFADYELNMEGKSLLTLTPRNPGEVTVSVNLDEYIGNDNGKLVFGGQNISRNCRDVHVITKPDGYAARNIQYRCIFSCSQLLVNAPSRFFLFYFSKNYLKASCGSSNNPLALRKSELLLTGNLNISIPRSHTSISNEGSGESEGACDVCVIS